MIEAKAASGGEGFLKSRAWIITLLAAFAISPAAGDGKSPEPGFEKGKLQEVTGPIGALLKLSWKGGTIRLDRQHWLDPFKGKTEADTLKEIKDELIRQGYSREHAASQARTLLDSRPLVLAFRKLRKAVGCIGAGTGRVGHRWYARFSGMGLSASVRTSKGTFTAMFEEEDGPRRKLELLDDESGALQIILVDVSGRLLLALSQGSEGRLCIVHIAGDEVLADKGESFQAFYAKHRSYVDGRLFPLLKHMGVGVPWTRYHARVKQCVLAKLRGPLTAEQIDRGKRLIQQLDDDSFKQREQATKTLSKNFARYRRLIKAAMSKASNPLEVASRLRRIVQANAGQDEIEEFIDSQRIDQDVAYLIELLGEADPPGRSAIIAALERLTKQKLGPNPAAWDKWWSQTRPATSPARD